MTEELKCSAEEKSLVALAQRVVVFQPALPAYRIDFFRRVAQMLGDRFTVRFAKGDMGVLTASFPDAPWARPLPPIRRFFGRIEWQPGVLTTPIGRGDIVVVSGAPRNLTNMLMLVWARLRGARTIWWGQYWSATSSRRNLWIRVRLMKLADALLFYTDQEVDAYRAGPGRNDRRPISALNNGINIEPIVALREPYEARSRDRAILFIGRLTPKAELDTLLRAMADPRLSDLTLHVVGDGETRPQLEALAADLRVENNIVWHGGTTDEAQIADVANRCRLFVYPGAVGLSLVHAMAYGLPAIVHADRLNHMPEIAAFGAGETGEAFERRSWLSLAEVVSRVSSDAPLLNVFSINSQRRTTDAFNTEAMGFRFVRATSELVKNMEGKGQ